MNISKRGFIFLVVIMIGRGNDICPQEKITWTAIQLPIRISSKWQLPVDFSYRTLGLSAAAYQYTFRGGVRRFINKTWSVAGGLAEFFTRISFKKTDEEFGPEFRLWQEGATESKLGKNFVLQNRLRIEERFFEATSIKEKYTAIRLRYRLGIVKYFNLKYKFQVAEEYMEHYAFDKFSFQQNRVYFSFGYLINALTQIEAGYIWSEIPETVRHYMTISFQRILLFHGNRNK